MKQNVRQMRVKRHNLLPVFTIDQKLEALQSLSDKDSLSSIIPRLLIEVLPWNYHLLHTLFLLFLNMNMASLRVTTPHVALQPVEKHSLERGNQITLESTKMIVPFFSHSVCFLVFENSLLRKEQQDSPVVLQKHMGVYHLRIARSGGSRTFVRGILTTVS